MAELPAVSTRKRRAFTLVELLVVITIIGVLVGMLLPAVQSARESARRARCVNNLKQIGMAMQQFHNVKDRFPPGAANDMPPFGVDGATRWGSSWMVYILPYVEAQNIYDQWQFKSHSGHNNGNNYALVNGLIIPVFRCASTSVPEFSANENLMNVSYTGIAGSAVTPGSAGTYQMGCCNGNGSWASDTGIFFAGSEVGMSDIEDGLSNTWMIGEQSDHLRDANGEAVKTPYESLVGNSSGKHGWTMGARHAFGGAQNGWSDGRHFNCTAVRYSINQTGFTGIAADGHSNDVGGNFPINSAHPRGAQICMADGSIQFATDSMPLNLIHAHCTRAGGEVVFTSP